ncbi:MAG: 50S ribosomal protein L10 [Bacillota bacterium]|nr:50S ribosomal protein L10 [Bacillota bacterium]HHU43846.1 50S ribosomal protein L10 [Clostridiales bacterium]
MLNKEQKKAKVAEIKEKLEKASSFILIDYKGLNVAQDTELRNAYRECDVTYEVMKNRLLALALKELGYDQFDEALKGPTAVAMGSDDIAAPARIALEKSKAFKKITIKCGLAEGKFLDEAGCQQLATIPSRDGLLSQIIGLLQSPIAGLARVLQAIAEKHAEA